VGAKIHIHKTHRQFTNGLEVVEVQGSTVGECLKDLMRQHPGMEKSIFTKNGKLNPVVEIYVNAESAYPDELAKRVKDGDDIHITLMLAGG
jgi:molybdopterin converting factor small subunit